MPTVTEGISPEMYKLRVKSTAYVQYIDEDHERLKRSSLLSIFDDAYL